MKPLSKDDIDGPLYEVIKRLYGRRLKTSHGWGEGSVVGAWRFRQADEENSHLRLLLACPNAENPVQLFNEDARDYI